VEGIFHVGRAIESTELDSLRRSIPSGVSMINLLVESDISNVPCADA